MRYRHIKCFIPFMIVILLFFIMGGMSSFADKTESTKPKYIFIIIGDGMGQGHLRLGSVYQKVLMGDQQASVYWDRFPMKRDVIAGGESAGGGTALATGAKPSPDIISQDSEGQALTTILDLAKAQGMATGVVTNASITDATPATFIAHADDRLYVNNIANDGATSGVDYLCGGGLGYMRREKDCNNIVLKDAAGSDAKCIGLAHHLQTYRDHGYSIFAGLSGAKSFLNAKQLPDKLLGVFSNGNMIFQGIRVSRRWEPQTHFLPTLMNLVDRGIQRLLRNENGFVFVIEEALIDKASHKQCMDLVAMEMEIMNRTLKIIFDFYQEYPNETLIIFTADHECGDYIYNDEQIAKFESLPSIPWSEGYDAVCRVLSEDWHLDVPLYELNTGMLYAQEKHWASYEDNMALAAQTVIVPLCTKIKIRSNSKGHSSQRVLLYTMGIDADRFMTCDYIYDIPRMLCDIMEWPMLPLTVKNYESTATHSQPLDRFHTIPVGSTVHGKPHRWT